MTREVYIYICCITGSIIIGKESRLPPVVNEYVEKQFSLTKLHDQPD